MQTCAVMSTGVLGGKVLRCLVGAISLVGLVACSPLPSGSAEPSAPSTGSPDETTEQEQAEAEKKEAEEAARHQAETEAAEVELAQLAAADVAAAAATSAAATETVAVLCEEICTKVDTACNPRAAAFCRASCGDYVIGAETCPVEVTQALECQSEADGFLLCSNIAAENCASLFKSMQQCRAGEIEPKSWDDVQGTVVGEKMPQGWQRLLAPTLGFSALMPEVVRVETGAELYGAKAEDASHFVLTIEQVAIRAGSPSDSTILRTALKYVGKGCEAKLRLHGRYESEGVIHVRFRTACEDQSQYRGVIHFWQDKAVVMSSFMAGSAGSTLENPHLEDFLFGFRLSAAPSETSAAD